MLLFVACAKRGSISGGAKDSIAPILKSSLPKNFTKNFSGTQLVLNFNEYIKLKDVNKQLVISPPMSTIPEVLPNNPSRTITVKIKDTLKPNTTYNFNFGNSIQDNNEGNSFSDFKFVFSTGNEIDTLKIGGVIKDALELKSENFVSVMLYEMNEKYTDSIIYKQKPQYITNTLDNLKPWKIENIKPGKYMLVAMKDFNNNFKFEPKTDKIAFYNEPITIPNNNNYELKLFKEALPFKALKLSQASGNKAILAFEGDASDLKVVLSNGKENLPITVTKIPQKDSLQVWFNKIKIDSINLFVSKGNYSKNFTFKIKNQKKDTLSFTAQSNVNIDFRENFEINSSTPLIAFDNSKIKLICKDSISVSFTLKYDDYQQKLKFYFEKKELENYTFSILPGAFTDFYKKTNAKLIYKLATKSLNDYGSLFLTLENVKSFPIIVELTNDDGKVCATEYSESSLKINFLDLVPGKFNLRIIYDINDNKKWDSGNYLKKNQCEEVEYFAEKIDIVAFRDTMQTFSLK